MKDTSFRSKEKNRAFFINVELTKVSSVLGGCVGAGFRGECELPRLEAPGGAVTAPVSL